MYNCTSNFKVKLGLSISPLNLDPKMDQGSLPLVSVFAFVFEIRHFITDP